MEKEPVFFLFGSLSSVVGPPRTFNSNSYSSGLVWLFLWPGASGLFATILNRLQRRSRTPVQIYIAGMATHCFSYIICMRMYSRMYVLAVGKRDRADTAVGRNGSTHRWRMTVGREFHFTTHLREEFC
ncbi:unnamed protein product [Ectocarpus sp. 12 AP-2014]